MQKMHTRVQSGSGATQRVSAVDQSVSAAAVPNNSSDIVRGAAHAQIEELKSEYNVVTKERVWLAKPKSRMQTRISTGT